MYTHMVSRYSKATMAALALFAIIAALSVNSYASQFLTGSEIKKSISNKKVFLSTRFGVEFPLFYRANGKVTGDGTGTGLGKFFAPRETGKWWVSGKKLCQQFPTWYKSRRLCFTLERTGNRSLIWRQDNGDQGKARIVG